MIEKKIIMDGREVPFKTSAALPRLYRQYFSSDIFIDLNNIRTKVGKNKKAELPPTALSTIENLAYCMAKHADPSISDSVEEWLAQFSTTTVYLAAQQIMEMWNEEQKMLSTPKNRQSR